MFENLTVIEAFKSSLQTAIKASKLSHAIIFEGSDEQTRLLAARETAQAILCKNIDKPCKCCSSCVKAENCTHPDLHILTKADGEKMIKVDAVRDIRSKAMVLPNDGDKSVFIIHEAHFMNTQAQNALLKIFEEPSAHVSFILTCASKSSLLETINSRATSYLLGEERASESSSEESEAAAEKASELVKCFLTENEFSFLRKTAVFVKDKAFFKSTLNAMIPIVRDALILQSGGKELLSGNNEAAALMKNQLTQKKTLALVGALQALADDVEKAANHNLCLTRFSAILYNIKSS